MFLISLQEGGNQNMQYFPRLFEPRTLYSPNILQDEFEFAADHALGNAYRVPTTCRALF